MEKLKSPFPFLVLLGFLTGCFIFPFSAFSQPSQEISLKNGISQYREENFEEAVEILEKIRKEDPNSSSAAFFLGLAYKQIMDYDKAFENLSDAVTLTPPIKEALIELINISIRLNRPEEAKKWIAVAEGENIFPAKTAFLKGRYLQKEKKNMEAVEAYEKAKSLDKRLTQRAEFQIAMCYLSDRRLKQAKELFISSINRDPLSDLAGFARQYQDMIDKRLFLERPLRITVGVFGRHDTNLVLKPTDGSLAPAVTDKDARVLATSLRLNYVPKLDGNWLFNAQYALASNIHSDFTHSHDSLANVLSVSPGYNFGRASLNLPVSYSHALVRNPSYKGYVGTLNLGPQLRVLLSSNHILEVYGGYTNSNYKQSPLIQEENRDNTGLSSYLSWIWLFKKGAFFNMRYGFDDIDADGVNWDNDSHKISANLSIPVLTNVVFQASAMATYQEYDNVHTVFQVQRDESIYSGSIGMTWEFLENKDLIVQYSHTRADSNVGIYDYDKNVYSLGLEFRF